MNLMTQHEAANITNLELAMPLINVKATNVVPLLRPTDHYRGRRDERGLSLEVQEYIIKWAKPVYRSGMINLSLRWKDLPESECHSKMAQRAIGWIVVQSHDGALVTTYWRQDAVGYLKRKPRNSLKHGQLAKRDERRRQEQEATYQVKKNNRKHNRKARIESLIPFSPSAA